ncbi:MAG: DinB family protein [Dokdonella sp.]
MLHSFNHQTHHRGQASTLLSQAGIDLGATDLVAPMRLPPSECVAARSRVRPHDPEQPRRVAGPHVKANVTMNCTAR